MLELVGSLGWESMANALCNLGLSLGFSNFLVLQQPVTVIHLTSLFSPSSNIPTHRHLLPELSFSAYLPKSTVNLMHGLKSTSSSLHIDLKRYSLYFLFHMHLSVDAMGLITVVFLAMGACVLIWLVVLVLLLFSVRLGLFGFLVLAFA